MSDTETRAKARRAKAEPDDVRAVAAHGADMARRGEGVIGFLLELIGKQVWIEGIRINYRGTLREVLRNSDGTTGALVLSPFQRVSYFQKGGPDTSYTYNHTKPHLVPYEVVHDIGEEGFAEGAWPAPK